MNAVEHDQAQQASDRLVATLRSLSSGIRENFRSIEDATAPGRALARKHRAEAILKDTTAVLINQTMRSLFTRSSNHHNQKVLLICLLVL